MARPFFMVNTPCFVHDRLLAAAFVFILDSVERQGTPAFLLGLYVVAVILLCPKTADLVFTGLQHNVIHVDEVPAPAFRGIDKPIKLPAGHLNPLDLFRLAFGVFHPKISLVHCFLRFWHLW